MPPLFRLTAMLTVAIGSSVSGDSVSVVAGINLSVLGSAVSSTGKLTLMADGNVTIAAAENTYDENHSREEKKSGLMGSGGVGFSVGTLQQSKGDVSSSTTAASSMLGSTDGNVDIMAAKNYAQVGSYVIAPKGDLSISAERVDILKRRRVAPTAPEPGSGKPA